MIKTNAELAIAAIAISLVAISCEKLGEMVNPPSYSIVYNGNGGIGYMKDSFHEYGKAQDLSSNAFTRTGYRFTGWADSPSGTVKYNNRQSVKNITKKDGAAIMLYAQWDSHSYTVVYDSNGGSGIMDDSVHIYDEEQQLNANAFTHAGYAFIGWALSPAGTVEYVNRNIAVNLTAVNEGTVTLYAIWETNRYTIVYNANGGDGNMYDSIFTLNESNPLRQNGFTRTGYTFVGWAPSITETAAYKDEQNVINAASVGGEIITLYAQWLCTITFDRNNNDDGSTAASPQSKTITTPAIAVDELPAEPERPGWAFAGWNTHADGSGSAFTESTAVGGSIAVYAQWSCSITFNGNGGTPASQAVAVSTPATNVGTLPAEPARLHWKFIGWNAHADGSGLPFAGYTAVTGTATVYAQWEPNTYTVTFNRNNADSGSTEANPPVKTITAPAATVNTLPEAPARTGWTFDGWNTEADGSGLRFAVSTTVTEDITVYAQWSCTVTFDKNTTDAGSTGANPQTITVAAPATSIGALPEAPTLPGWAFTGWNTQADGSGFAFTAYTAIAGDITVYAQWMSTVTFSMNNADSGSTEASPQAMEVRTPATGITALPAEPTRHGYIFAGWNTQPNGSGSVFTEASVITGNVTVYAQWILINNYIVIFNRNNATAGSTDANPQTKTVTTPETTAGMLPTAPTRPGWEFTGWNRQPDGGGTPFDADTPVASSITVYAQWKCAVTFDKNNTDAESVEANPPVREIATPAAAVSLPEPPSRPGWSFIGWNTQPNGSVPNFTAATAVTGNATVYAVWTCSIAFNGNNGTPASQTRTVTTPSTTVGTLPSVSRTGWTFTGWNTEADGSGSSFSAATTVTGDTTVYAQWVCLVTFSKNNASAGSTDANPPSIEVIFPETTIGVLPENPTRQGWAFTGWNTQINGSGTPFTATAAVSGSITVYAQWMCTVAFNKNNNDEESDDANPPTRELRTPATTVPLPIAPTRQGWTFTGWNTEANGSGTNFTASTTVNGDTPVYAQWTCAVTFSRNNTDAESTQPNPQTITIATPARNVATLPAEPTRQGWTFTGWNAHADGSGSAFIASTTVTGNATVFAQWKPHNYTVVYNANGGSGAMLPSDFTYSVFALLRENAFTRAGYEFAGWAASATGSVLYADQQSIRNLTTTDNGVVSLFAQWSCAVTFDRNNDDAGSTQPNPQARTLTTPATTVALPTAPTRTGWTFTGWNTEKDGSDAAFTASTAVKGKITVYAQWSCVVEFSSNGGIPTTPQKRTVTTLTKTVGTLPADPTRIGYTFDSWNTRADGKGDVFTATTPVTGNITVYAKWLYIEMVKIPAGTYTRGSSNSLDLNASPSHQVRLTNNFFMGKFEVSQTEYEEVMGYNPSNYSGSGRNDHPVENVTWFDAVEFCNRLSGRENLDPVYELKEVKTTYVILNSSYFITSAIVTANWNANGYRLPTEAEWEYACRAGTTTAYNNGRNDIIDGRDYPNQKEANFNHVLGRTAKVGTSAPKTNNAPNGFGLYDMHGNVWEWCWDRYGAYSSGLQIDPKGHSSNVNRVLRGGCWNNVSQNLRSAYRFSYPPSNKGNGDGFRVVRNANG